VANIQDVARLAGVSHQTVSRVINRVGNVRPQTEARVEAAMAELNYRPSSVARALATRTTNAIGLVSTGNPLYGPSSIALAFNEAAREAGYQVITASMGVADRDAIVSAVDVLLRQRVDALVVVATDRSTVDAVNGLRFDVPLVVADSGGASVAPSVAIDQVAGAVAATAHLAELGHRSIRHIAGPAGSLDGVEREAGWRAELERRGLPVVEPLRGDWTAESGRIATEQLLQDRDFTALFVSNDQMALGVLHAFAAAGVSVPGDVSVVGFDDIPESAHFTPSLTTVRQDFGALGHRMMDVVRASLAGEPLARTILPPPELVIRASA
jgi:DNA-binding LacI/PurR family transcriptional regulator